MSKEWWGKYLQKSLVEAAARGDKDGVTSLLSQGAVIRNSGALHKAVDNGQVDMVRFLISHGANIEKIKPRRLYSVLIYAAGKGQKDVLEALLDLGANVNQSSNGMTALCNSITCNMPESVAILLKHGAKVNATDRNLDTPLHVAIKQGHSEIAKLLVASPGIKINAKNGEGKTPLHVALRKSLNEIVGLLFDNGADPTLRDNNGKTAFDLCSDLTSELADEIKSFQLERKELETKNKELKKMLEDTKKRQVELEKKVEDLERQMKRKEDLEDEDKMERVVEMKSFEDVVDRLKTDLKLRMEEFERKLESRLDGIELLYKETESCRSSQFRDDETSLEDSILDVKECRSQLEASSGRVDVSEKIESLEAEVTGVKIVVRSLQMALDRHFDSSAKDQADLRAEIIALTKLWKNANTSRACADNFREKNLVQLASELEEKCQAIAKEVSPDRAQQDQTKVTKLNNFKSIDIKKKKSNKDLEFERKKIEREKVSDTVEIVGVRETEGENVARLVQSLSLLLGTVTDDVKEIRRTSNYVIEVQFLNVESARSWIMAFEERKELAILACNLNRSLDKIEISVNRKLTNYQGRDGKRAAAKYRN